MDYRTTAAHNFSTRLGFKKIWFYLSADENKKFIWRKNMQTQYSVLSYRIDLFFHDYKIAIEIYESGYSGNNIDYVIQELKKAIDQEIEFD